MEREGHTSRKCLTQCRTANTAAAQIICEKHMGSKHVTPKEGHDKQEARNTKTLGCHELVSRHPELTLQQDLGNIPFLSVCVRVLSETFRPGVLRKLSGATRPTNVHLCVRGLTETLRPRIPQRLLQNLCPHKGHQHQDLGSGTSGRPHRTTFLRCKLECV